LITVSLAAVLGVAGIVSPIVQRRELRPEHVASATFVVLVAGIVLTGVTAFFAIFLGPAIFGTTTSDLLMLSSAAWFIAALGATSQAMLQRELRFRVGSGIEAIAATIGVVVSLTAAIAGLEGGALVLGALALLATTSILSFAAARPPFPLPTRRGLSEIYRFASTVTTSSLVFLTYRNADYAILGARSTPAQVGLYWRAYQLGVAYQAKVSNVMLRVSFPILSRAETIDEMRRLRVRIVRTHATVLVPTLATFVGVAPVLVPWLFGPSWESAVEPAQIMAIAGIADAITAGVGPLMLALGRPRELLVWNVVQLVAFVLLVFALAPHGTSALAVGVAGFGVFNVVAIQAGLLRPYAGLSFRQLWRDIRAGCAAGAAVAVTTVATRVVLDGNVPDLVLLTVLGLVATASAVGVLRIGFRAELADVARIVRRAPQPVEPSE
jgi:O-antigen/teichoic acid export membrane protein